MVQIPSKKLQSMAFNGLYIAFHFGESFSIFILDDFGNSVRINEQTSCEEVHLTQAQEYNQYHS